MSIRTDAGKCRFCGTVALVEELIEFETGEDGPTYVCGTCADERGIERPGSDERPSGPDLG